MAVELPEDQVRIVYLTNPFNEDFTHSFDGHPITIPAGETVRLTEPEANLLLRHMKGEGLISDEPPVSEVDEEEDEVLAYLEEALTAIEHFCIICAESSVEAERCENEECRLWEFRPGALEESSEQVEEQEEIS